MPWAERTGNLTLRTDAVVQSVIYDDKKEKVTGVRVIDSKTKEVTEYFAKVIFRKCCGFKYEPDFVEFYFKTFP
jgi:hypothetical protein